MRTPRPEVRVVAAAEDAAVARAKAILDDAVAATAALVGSAATQEELASSLQAIAYGHDDTGDDADVVAALEWLSGVRGLGAVLRRGWSESPGELERVRRRFGLIRRSAVHAAAAARRKRAIAPEELRRRLDELVATGRARSKRQAAEILGREVCLTARYIENRARTHTSR
jgi:hypothetical protein